MKRSKKRIVALFGIIMALFLGLALYLTYFQIVEAESYRNNSINMRNWVDETQFGRGIFLDRNDHEIIVREQNGEGSFVRYSQHPHMYAHIIGYNSVTYGKTGLESSYNTYLLNLQDNPISQLRGQILDRGLGNDVKLTIDNELQYLAYNLLSGHKGSIVALDPKTGEVLAMVSMPSFNMNNVDEDWNLLIENEDSPLYNRATMGLYQPGSTMKAVTAVSILEQGINQDYVDEAYTTINGFTYANYGDQAYGDIRLREALIHSSNVYFADKSQLLYGDDMRRTVDNFYFNKRIPFDLETSISKAEYHNGMDVNVKAANSFGQGELLVTPLQMALVYGAIANDGIMMQPYLVDRVISPNGYVVKSNSPTVLSRVSQTNVVQELQDYLQATMEEKVSSAQIMNYAVAGKTGTAENDSGYDHAWYCGYAPADNPQIAIAVILESEGATGGEAASPIAGQIFDYWLNQR